MTEISDGEARMLQSKIDKLKGRIENLEEHIQDQAESEDKCERCDGDGVIRTYVEGERSVPCPNCSDESEDDKFGNYDRDEIIPGVEKDTFQNESEEYDEPRPDDEDLVSGLSEKPAYHLQILVDYIRELEQELESVREERDDWQECAQYWEDLFQKSEDDYYEIRSRIAEARNYMESIGRTYGCNKNVLMSILTQDSDEGDGFDE